VAARRPTAELHNRARFHARPPWPPITAVNARPPLLIPMHTAWLAGSALRARVPSP
jgi:hypothetical protein